MTISELKEIIKDLPDDTIVSFRVWEGGFSYAREAVVCDGYDKQLLVLHIYVNKPFANPART